MGMPSFDTSNLFGVHNHIPTHPNHQPDSSSNCSLLPSWSSRSFIELGTQHGEINRQKDIQYNIHNRIEVGPKFGFV
jgi:hypothetical protein